MGGKFLELRVDYEVDDFEIIWQRYDGDFFFIILKYYWKMSCIVMAETQFPHESLFIISFRLLLRLLAILSGILTVENRDVSSANNVGLHWRLWDKSLMYIRNKSSPSIEPWETTALILAQDELWWLCVTLCFLFLKMPVKRFNEFSEIPLRVTLWIISLYYTLSKTFEMSRNTALTS